MSCKTSIGNAFKVISTRRSMPFTSQLLVHRRTLSRSTTSSQQKQDIEPSPPDAGPVIASSDCSVDNEARWKNLSRAKRASGNLCSGRSILLTGGTSGIGLAIAKRAVVEGASHVIIVTRSSSNGKTAVETVTEATGFSDAPVSYLSHDFSRTTPETIKSVLGPLNINTLINCSGVTSNQLVIKQRHEDAELVWDTNYHMPFKLSQHLLNSYLARSRSLQKKAGLEPPQNDQPPSWCIVNVSSLLAEKGGKGSATYAATKAALTALTRVLALESGDLSERSQAVMPPLRVNAILPGYIETPMIEGFSEARKAELTAQIPLRRFGNPAEVADAIMFLLHNEYANNCILRLDGGLSAV